MQSFKEIQPAKWDTSDADLIDLVASNHWLGLRTQPRFATAHVHDRDLRRREIAAGLRDFSLTFGQNVPRSDTSERKTSLREDASQASLSDCMRPKLRF